MQQNQKSGFERAGKRKRFVEETRADSWLVDFLYIIWGVVAAVE